MIFLYLLGGALMVWLGFRLIKGSPEAFSKQSIAKSFYTLGILALLLIALIAICVKLIS